MRRASPRHTPSPKRLEAIPRLRNRRRNDRADVSQPQRQVTTYGSRSAIGSQPPGAKVARGLAGRDRDEATGSGRKGVQRLHRGVERPRTQQDVRRPCDQDALAGPSVSKPVRHLEEKLSERGASLDLHDPWAAHRARYAEDPCPATIVGDHGRKRSEGRDGADHGGLSPQPQFGRRKRCRLRRRSLALDGPEEHLFLLPPRTPEAPA